MMKNGGCATKVLSDKAIYFEKKLEFDEMRRQFEFSSGIGSFVC